MTNRLFEVLLPSRRRLRVARRLLRSLSHFSCLILWVLCCSACSVIGGGGEQRPDISYQVRPGDSLFIIARRFDVTVVEIQALNRIRDPRKIQVGQVLSIPNREPDESQPHGGPYVSAETAKKERARVSLPPLKSLGARLAMPVRGSKIGSRFGYRGSRFHEGLDLVINEGAPVYAAHDGIVIFSGQRLSGYGKMVAIKQGQIMTIYAHNSANFVNRGDRVSTGDLIAEVGQTGRATGPHLHFEVRVRGDDGRYYAVEPFEFLSAQ